MSQETISAVTQTGFVVCWAVGVVAWFHATYHFMRWWLRALFAAGSPPGALRKSLPGYGVFIAAVLMAFLMGAIGESWGGGWR